MTLCTCAAPAAIKSSARIEHSDQSPATVHVTAHTRKYVRWQLQYWPDLKDGQPLFNTASVCCMDVRMTSVQSTAPNENLNNIIIIDREFVTSAKKIREF